MKMPAFAGLAPSLAPPHRTSPLSRDQKTTKTCASAVSRSSSSATDPAISASAHSAALPGGLRHFLHVDDFSSEEVSRTLSLAARCKALLRDREFAPLVGRTMAMIFAKPSSRTRVSFETGVFHMGGHALCLGPEVGVNTREAAKDIGRLLPRFNDVVMARLFAHRDLLELAEVSAVPVINGLTDYNHPCQIMADALTVVETRGGIEGAKVVYVGDGNNIVHSWFELAARLPFHFVCCCPEGYLPDAGALARVREGGVGTVEISHDPREAVRGADAIYTDVWASMGQKEEIEERERAFAGFQVTGELIRSTGADTKFMHCLPAERGRECTDEAMEGAWSVVFQQAENRMHAQNAIVLECMGLAAPFHDNKKLL